SYGTAQEFLALQEYVLPYRPDVVVLGFFAGNDLSNNVRDLEQNPDRPYFTLSGSTLIPDFSFREKAFYVDRQKWRRRTLEAVHTHSRVVQLLWEVRRRWQVRDTKNMHDTAVESGLDSLIYTPPATPLFQEAWDV